MNKLLLAALISVTSSSSIAGWTEIWSLDGIEKTYVDSSSISTNGNMATMRNLIDFEDLHSFKNLFFPKAVRYLSRINEIEYDCANMTTNLVDSVLYADHMGSGVAVHVSKVLLLEKPFRIIQTTPKTHLELLFDVACGSRQKL